MSFFESSIDLLSSFTNRSNRNRSPRASGDERAAQAPRTTFAITAPEAASCAPLSINAADQLLLEAAPAPLLGLPTDVQQALSGMTTMLSTMMSQLQLVTTSVSSLDDKVTASTAAVRTMQTCLGEIVGKVDATATKVTTIIAKVAEQDASISTILHRQDAAEAQQQSQAASHATTASDVEGLQAVVADLQAQIKALTNAAPAPSPTVPRPQLEPQDLRRLQRLEDLLEHHQHTMDVQRNPHTITLHGLVLPLGSSAGPPALAKSAHQVLQRFDASLQLRDIHSVRRVSPTIAHVRFSSHAACDRVFAQRRISLPSSIKITMYFTTPQLTARARRKADTDIIRARGHIVFWKGYAELYFKTSPGANPTRFNPPPRQNHPASAPPNDVPPPSQHTSPPLSDPSPTTGTLQQLHHRPPPSTVTSTILATSSPPSHQQLPCSTTPNHVQPATRLAAAPLLTRPPLPAAPRRPPTDVPPNAPFRAASTIQPPTAPPPTPAELQQRHQLKKAQQKAVEDLRRTQQRQMNVFVAEQRRMAESAPQTTSLTLPASSAWHPAARAAAAARAAVTAVLTSTTAPAPSDPASPHSAPNAPPPTTRTSPPCPLLTPPLDPTHLHSLHPTLPTTSVTSHQPPSTNNSLPQLPQLTSVGAAAPPSPPISNSRPAPSHVDDPMPVDDIPPAP